MRRGLGLLLVAMLGCDALWSSSLIPNPQRCDVTPSVCAASEVCDVGSGLCKAAVVPGATRCGVAWRTGTAAASFQTTTTLVSTGTAGDLVSIALGDLDGNGRLDLAAVSDAGTLWTYLGSGAGQLASLGTASIGGTAGLLRLADA